MGPDARLVNISVAKVKIVNRKVKVHYCRSWSHFFLHVLFFRYYKMASNSMVQIEKLQGRENYATWSFAVRTYLEHEDLWKCVDGAVGEFDKVEDTKARTKIILLVDSVNYIHIQEAKTAKEVWSNLRKSFDDSGLTRKVGLLRELITTDLEGCGSVETYVNKVITCAHKLRNIGFIVDDEWLGTLLLAGLPESYKPMIMAMESSGVKISTDLVKTKILQDVKNTSDSAAFYSNHKGNMKYNNNNTPSGKGPRCFKCNKYGHISKYCRSSQYLKQNNNNKKYSNTNKASSSSFVAAFAASPDLNKGCWYLDSGAAMHMTNNKDWLYDYGPAPVTTIKVADNKTLTVKGCGKVNLRSFDHVSKELIGVIQVKNVLYVPDLAVNLLSIHQITKNNCEVKFSKDYCNIYHDSKLVMTGYAQNNLYIVYNESYALLTSVHLWHQRLGHLNYQSLKKLNESADGVDMEVIKQDKHLICNTCLQGKQTRQPFKNEGTRASGLLQVIHSDVCGPMEEKSLGGARYYVTFTDDYSRKVFVYFMHSKSQVLEKFKEFKNFVENQLDTKIKSLRSDNGKEYVNETFDKFCKDSGIRRQFTVPYSPEQNGMSERMNRTLVERAKCLLIDAKVPKKFWAEAVSTAAYLINRSPTKAIDYKTPEEKWTGVKPNIKNIRVFGCRAFVHVPKEKRLKWDSKANELIFVGYCPESKGYRLYDEKSGKIIRSRDVVFLEENIDKNFSLMPITSNLESGESNMKEDSNTNLNDSSSSYDSISTAKENVSDDENYVPDQIVTLNPSFTRNLRPRKGKSIPTYICMSDHEQEDPQTIKQALESDNKLDWQRAMDSEYSSLLKNNTWTLTELPVGKKIIPCKWVFKTKLDADGNVSKYKARLVIKGYEQKFGVDYTEVYAPVVRLTTIRYLLGIAAKHNLFIEQLDAVCAFLQGDIDVELYMSQPPHYEDGSVQVCKLNKSIYGLKQASRAWNKKLDSYLFEIGFKKSELDPCVYYAHCDNNNILFLTVFVDDILLFYNNENLASKIKKKIIEKFEMKDLKKAKFYIGHRITVNNEGIQIDQNKYIENILKRFGMENCNPVGTPMESNLKFSDTSEKIEEKLYQELIGCLLYISQGTRPDISYAVNNLSQYNKNPTKEHYNAAKRILRYLQGTKDLRLHFKSDIEKKITGYCDSDWASCKENRRSCTGYTFIFQGAAISWNSKRQQTVALSTTEAEYMALSTATQEALWLKQLHHELWPSTEATPITLYCDNQSAIKLTGNSAYHARSKHIDVRHHFIRDRVASGDITVKYIDTNLMVADCFTKALPKPKHTKFLKDMGLRS